jgi:hypothetical protein
MTDEATVLSGWDFSGPLVMDYTIQPASKVMMTIHHDGRITVSEDAAPTETAKQVLDAMQSILQGMLLKEYQRGYDDATGFQEGGSGDAQVITDPAAIRAAFEKDCG